MNPYRKKIPKGTPSIILDVLSKKWDSLERELDLGNVDNLAHPTPSGGNILHILAWENKHKLLKKVLDLGLLNIDQGDSRGLTPLILALRQNSKEAIEILLENKADCRSFSVEGYSHLHAACHGKVNFKFIDHMIAQGAKTTPPAPHKQRFLLSSVFSNTRSNTDFCSYKYIEKYYDFDQNDQWSLITAFWAAKHGNSRILKEVLSPSPNSTRKAISINSKDDKGLNLLEMAIASKSQGCVNLILDHEEGLEIFKPSHSNNFSAIQMAIFAELEETAIKLIDIGFSLSSADATLRTALHSACAKGQYNVTKRILECEPSIIPKLDKNNKDFITVCMEKDNPELIKLAIEICGENYNDELFDLLLKNRNLNSELLSLLSKDGKRPCSPKTIQNALKRSLAQKDYDSASHLIDTITDDLEPWVYFSVAEFRKENLLIKILQRSIPTGVNPDNGENILLAAIRNKHKEAVSYLFEHNPELLDGVNSGNENAGHYLVDHFSKKDRSKYIDKIGGAIFYCDNKGRSPANSMEISELAKITQVSQDNLLKTYIARGEVDSFIQELESHPEKATLIDKYLHSALDEPKAIEIARWLLLAGASIELEEFMKLRNSNYLILEHWSELQTKFS